MGSIKIPRRRKNGQFAGSFTVGNAPQTPPTAPTLPSAAPADVTQPNTPVALLDRSQRPTANQVIEVLHAGARRVEWCQNNPTQWWATTMDADRALWRDAAAVCDAHGDRAGEDALYELIDLSERVSAQLDRGIPADCGPHTDGEPCEECASIDVDYEISDTIAAFRDRTALAKN